MALSGMLRIVIHQWSSSIPLIIAKQFSSLNESQQLKAFSPISDAARIDYFFWSVPLLLVTRDLG